MKIRTVLVALVALVVVFGIALMILMGRVDGWRPQIQAELQQKLNLPVSIGHLGLRLLPLELTVQDFSIGEAQGFPQERPFATASHVFVSASLFSLSGRKPSSERLDARKAASRIDSQRGRCLEFLVFGQEQ